MGAIPGCGAPGKPRRSGGMEMAASKATDLRWELVVAIGPGPCWAGSMAPSVLRVDPGSLEQSGLSAADLRTLTAVAVDTVDASSMAAWAFLSGLAGRLLEVIGPGPGGVPTPAGIPAALAAAGRFEVDPGMQTLDELAVPADQAVALCADPRFAGEVRRARRVTVVGGEGLGLFVALATLAGVRDRGGARLPQLGLDDGLVVDLEGQRRAGAAERRRTNAPTSAVRAVAVPPTERQRRLSEAADTPVTDVLGWLGSACEDGLWNCPRPHRHTHGDAVPSLRVEDNRVRCLRCDREALDALRLVMEVTGCGPDDAASMLCAGTDAFSDLRARIRQVREERAGVRVP